MITARTLIVTTLLPFATLAAQAAEPVNGWSGRGELGFLSSRGNTDSDSANAKLDVAYTKNDWKHSFFLGALYGKSADITTAERWEARLQSDRRLSDRAFAFGALRYEDDRFSGFQYQASATLGMGYKVVDRDATKLAARAGVGYRSLRTELLVKDASGAVVQRIPGESSGEAIVTAGVDYEHAFNASTKLIDKFLVESGSSNTSLQNDLALQVKMSEKFALSAGYGVRNNSDPPAGLEKLDTVMTLNLVYAF